MRLLKEDCCLLVIDIQSRLFPHIHQFQEFEDSTCKLIEGAKALDLPIFVSEQYVKGLGETTENVQIALGDAYKPIEKMAFSCMDMDEFKQFLKKTNKKNVLICGIESHICILQTALDLLEAGLKPVVIENCVSSRKLSDKETAVRRLLQEGSVVSSYESVLFELCRYSGTPEFKAISKIIK
jgi:nicotinamidase-related amidase